MNRNAIKRLLTTLVSFLLFVLLTSCSPNNGLFKRPTSTNVPESNLFENLEKPDVRGIIIKIYIVDGKVNAIYVEGDGNEEEYNFDKASVGITDSTAIFMQTLESYKLISSSELSSGQKVEIIFEGRVLESYPVQANAKEILVLNEGDEP